MNLKSKQRLENSKSTNKIFGDAMKKNQKKKRRSDTKVLTHEARVLKIMRESRKLSMRRAAKKLNVSDTLISHAENGRLDLRPELIQKLISGYGYSYSEFLDFNSGKIELPEALKSECIEIINRLSFEKLKTVKSILHSF